MPVEWIQVALILGALIVWAIVSEVVIRSRQGRGDRRTSQTGSLHRSDPPG